MSATSGGRQDGPATRGAVSLPEDAIAAEMFSSGFTFDTGWLAQYGDAAARLALKFFSEGEPDALIQLVQVGCIMPSDVLQNLGAILCFSGMPSLRAVAAATRKKTGRKMRWKKYLRLHPTIAGLYRDQLALARANDDGLNAARDRAADAVAAMPGLRWLGLTRGAVHMIVTAAGKTPKNPKNAARRNVR